VKKTTNVTNARLTLEFNVQGLLDVRVKPLKSRRINSSVRNSRRSRATVSVPQLTNLDSRGRRHLLARLAPRMFRYGADSTARNAYLRRAANTAIPSGLRGISRTDADVSQRFADSCVIIGASFDGISVT